MLHGMTPTMFMEGRIISITLPSSLHSTPPNFFGDPIGIHFLCLYHPRPESVPEPWEESEERGGGNGGGGRHTNNQG